MDREAIEIQLTPRERALILRYGYPFEKIERSLQECRQSSEIETVCVDHFELEHLIGDLCRSINDMEGGTVQDQLLNLCDRLEAAQMFGAGRLDEF